MGDVKPVPHASLETGHRPVLFRKAIDSHHSECRHLPPVIRSSFDHQEETHLKNHVLHQLVTLLS